MEREKGSIRIVKLKQEKRKIIPNGWFGNWLHSQFPNFHCAIPLVYYEILLFLYEFTSNFSIELIFLSTFYPFYLF